MGGRWKLSALVLLCGHIAAAQTRTIKPGDEVRPLDFKGKPLPATQAITATVSARLGETGTPPNAGGTLFLAIEAEYDPPGRPKWLQAPERIRMKIPLASTADAYGESRQCGVSTEGVRNFTYTAGLDEKNFVSFSAAAKPREFQFLVNKYICRALAAAYTCASRHFPPKEAKPSNDMRYWKVGTWADVELEGQSAGTRAEVTPVVLTSTGTPFDYAQCEKIAPSNGTCCVGGKTTAWHCGGKPDGPGWHQVSGDCYHRETGGTCTE